jgi:hypothetical protein
MIGYKLTKQDLTTYKGFQWELGKTVTTDGSGDLCSSSWLHFYNDPLLAILLNPIHATIKSPRLFEFSAEGTIKKDRGLKFGCTRGTLVREIEVPAISKTQRSAFGILCAKQVCKDEKWNKWADRWLSREDRSKNAAYAAAAAAADAAYAASAKLDLIAIAKEAMNY